ncbi:hypothetical protein, conserved [Entamoeba histolytica]
MAHQLVKEFLDLHPSLDYPTLHLIIYNVPKIFDKSQFLLLFPSDIKITSTDFTCLHLHFVVVQFDSVSDSIVCFHKVHSKQFCGRYLYVQFGYQIISNLPLNFIRLKHLLNTTFESVLHYFSFFGKVRAITQDGNDYLCEYNSISEASNAYNIISNHTNTEKMELVLGINQLQSVTCDWYIPIHSKYKNLVHQAQTMGVIPQNLLALPSNSLMASIILTYYNKEESEKLDLIGVDWRDEDEKKIKPMEEENKVLENKNEVPVQKIQDMKDNVQIPTESLPQTKQSHSHDTLLNYENDTIILIDEDKPSTEIIQISDNKDQKEYNETLEVKERFTPVESYPVVIQEKQSSFTTINEQAKDEWDFDLELSPKEINNLQPKSITDYQQQSSIPERRLSPFDGQFFSKDDYPNRNDNGSRNRSHSRHRKESHHYQKSYDRYNQRYSQPQKRQSSIQLKPNKPLPSSKKSEKIVSSFHPYKQTKERVECSTKTTNEKKSSRTSTFYSQNGMNECVDIVFGQQRQSQVEIKRSQILNESVSHKDGIEKEITNTNTSKESQKLNSVFIPRCIQEELENWTAF